VITLRRIGLTAATFYLAMGRIPNGWSQGLERFINGVVEVEAGKGADKATENGTGFVVSADGGTLLVLTARHLFYEGRQGFTNDISVTFYLDKLNPHKAELVTDSANLDLAVLRVSRVPASVCQQLPTFSVRPDSTPLSIGDALYVLGGRSQSWQVPTVSVSGLKDEDRPDRIRFTGIRIRGGFSGSALIDSNGRLAAVHLGVVESDENFGFAQRMAYAYGILKDRGVTMNKLDISATAVTVEPPVGPGRERGLAAIPNRLLTPNQEGSIQERQRAEAAFRRGQYYAAMPIYRQLADAGDSSAMAAVGTMYEKGGEGVPKDIRQAVQWHLKAAEAGNSAAMQTIGLDYMSGDGMPQDYAKAAYWLQQAADAGQPMAMGAIGVLYRYGRGVPKDLKQAAFWLRKAAATGDETAKQQLQQMGLGQ